MMKEIDILQVVSLEEGKVEIKHAQDGSLIVIKKTDSIEVENFAKMHEHLTKDGISKMDWHGDGYTVRTPNVVSWNQSLNTFITEYFEGENLELLLRIKKRGEENEYVNFSKEFISWMRDGGIIWGDAAPRNIIINKEKKEICVVDFEKGSLLQDSPYTLQEFNSVIRGVVYEEFGAFLFPDEQQEVFGEVWHGQEGLVSSAYFRGKREKILYQKLYGEINDQISLQNAISVQKLMSEIVTPYWLEGEVFFPLVYLAESQSAEEYTDKLLELVAIDRAKWKYFLEKK